jgi:hypothetical protein
MGRQPNLASGMDVPSTGKKRRVEGPGKENGSCYGGGSGMGTAAKRRGSLMPGPSAGSGVAGRCVGGA